MKANTTTTIFLRQFILMAFFLCQFAVAQEPATVQIQPDSNVSVVNDMASVDEGSEFSLTASVVGEDADAYSYQWTATAQEPSDLLDPNAINPALSGTTATSLNVRVVPNFIGRATSDSNVVFKVVVSAGPLLVARA